MAPSQLLNPAILAAIRPPLRLIATDMDGTLTQQGDFTPALLEALIALAEAQFTVLIVTGRSAGWVSGLAHYLPIAGAIAENGGVFFSKTQPQPQLLVPLPQLESHRQQLADVFQALQARFPALCPSADNRYRLTDWTFDIQGLSDTDLAWLADCCQSLGWGFTYSTVQCHIKLAHQDKAQGLKQVLAEHFPALGCQQVVTVGDSPNDESLFNPAIFPHSVGVANISHYQAQLTHYPTYQTQGAEAEGFCELARDLVASTTAEFLG